MRRIVKAPSKILVRKYTFSNGQRKMGAGSGWGWIEWGGKWGHL